MSEDQAGPPFRFYGRRHGKKPSARQEDLVENLLPKVAIDPANLPDTPLWLEIGCGGGEHLIGRALANPDITLLGCEPFMEGVAKILTQVHERTLTNVRVHADDARPLLEDLPTECIDRAFILFPDPWPKRRHNKRRFISNANLDRLARIMKPGSHVGIATDHMDYARWILAHFLDHPVFDWTAERADDWRLAPEGHVQTRYQQKGLEKGDAPVFFDFVRRA